MSKYVKQSILINNIPSIIWGENKDKVFIFVHGLESNKEDKLVKFFARCAVDKGYQVLSFDLPGHGDRIKEGIRCDVNVAVPNLQLILNYAKKNWKYINLATCSFGTYFSLLAYKDCKFDKCLFISPLVDMENMILSMLKKAKITLTRLEIEGEVRTYSETLYYDYYKYVVEHRIEKWDSPTFMIRAENDLIVDEKTITDFSEKYKTELEIIPNAEHFLHTESDYHALEIWLNKHFN